MTRWHTTKRKSLYSSSSCATNIITSSPCLSSRSHLSKERTNLRQAFLAKHMFASTRAALFGCRAIARGQKRIARRVTWSATCWRRSTLVSMNFKLKLHSLRLPICESSPTKVVRTVRYRESMRNNSGNSEHSSLYTPNKLTHIIVNRIFACATWARIPGDWGSVTIHRSCLRQVNGSILNTISTILAITGAGKRMSQTQIVTLSHRSNNKKLEISQKVSATKQCWTYYFMNKCIGAT